MKKFIIFASILAACFPPFKADQWIPDLGNGQYANPIIYADYSDPDVIRVDDDYWMVASSFNCIPGIPILHSKDLVNWELTGHVYDHLPLDKYDHPAHGEGSWAPAIRFHDGTYYVYFCTPNDGLFVAHSKNPLEGWTLTQILDVVKWEDPCPFWDDNGDAYLVHSIHRGGPAILHRMSTDGLSLLDNGTIVYHDEEANPILEGLKLYKRNGWYYIFAPAGGVVTGWQTVLRSRSIYGPYEARKVMEQGETEINGPHQGALVDTPDGNEWWFMHFQSRGNFGRVVHLQPAEWTADDWIVIGEDIDGDGIGNPVRNYIKPDIAQHPIVIPQTSDEFTSPLHSPQWQWQANPRRQWSSLSAKPGYLRLFAINCPSEKGNLYYAGNLYLQKFPAPEFTATTLVDVNFDTAGEMAGLITMGSKYSYIAIIKGKNGNQVAVVTGRNDKFAVTPQLQASVAVKTDKVWLRMELISDSACQYSYSLDGKQYFKLGDEYTVFPGVWIGAKTGIFCSSPNVSQGQGYADFDYFRIE